MSIMSRQGQHNASMKDRDSANLCATLQARDASSSPDFEEDEYNVDETQIAILISQFPDLEMEQAKEAVRGSMGDMKQSAQLISTGAIARKFEPVSGMKRSVSYSQKQQRWRWSTQYPV